MQVNYIDPVKLSELIVKYFDLSELKDLCWSVGVADDNLTGFTKKDKARALVEHLRTRDRLGDLLKKVKNLRPNVTWEKEVIICFDSTQIAHNFSSAKLEEITLKLNLIFENFSGGTEEFQVEALLNYCQQSGQLREFHEILTLELDQPCSSPTPAIGDRLLINKFKKWFLTILSILVLGLTGYWVFNQFAFLSESEAQATLVAYAIQATATFQASENQAKLTKQALEAQATLMSLTPTSAPALTPTPPNICGINQLTLSNNSGGILYLRVGNDVELDNFRLSANKSVNFVVQITVPRGCNVEVKWSSNVQINQSMADCEELSSTSKCKFDGLYEAPDNKDNDEILLGIETISQSTRSTFNQSIIITVKIS